MKHENIVDIRDIIERYEELDSLKDNSGGAFNEVFTDSMAEERGDLENILFKLRGYGGDEEWRGDWYPLTLIHEEYFTKYVKELLEDCDQIPRNLPKYIAIDWEQTAANIRADYSPIDIDGDTYFYRG